MGRILQTFGLQTKPVLEAQSAPQVLGEYSPYAMPFQYAYVSRTEAISVPALQRCRNLLAGTIGAIPLELYKKSTNEELGSPVWMEQPSYSQPRSVTIAYTVDSLLFYGQAFWKVIEVYSEDGRPARFEWIANNRLQSLGYKKIFDIKHNPIGGWLDSYLDAGKTHDLPQEKPLTDYIKGSRDTSIDLNQFTGFQL